MIDAPGTNPPRFPDSLRAQARDTIRDRLSQEVQRTRGDIVAIASGARGGDLLFHDVCEELKLEHRLYLPPDRFRHESVSPAGRIWENQFDKLVNSYPSVPYLSQSGELPLWLSVERDYMVGNI